ncbi:MAG TPA: CocE/NonD family hydrolase C-terminal non-catalytic domain-containing protein, partial [Nitriliruptorales bacterium]
DGKLAPWTTPDGTRRLTLAAAIPTITFSDVVNVLAPNGRVSDGWALAPPSGDVTNPIGVPIQSTLAGLLAAGNVFGHFAPPGVDPTADIVTDAARVLAGNPFPPDDPIISRAVELYREFKSPITTAPQGRVPIYWAHGFTDPLFSAFEPLALMNAVRAVDPTYPFALFLGDFGHDYAAQRVDEGQASIAEMNAFVDHVLRPDRTPVEPAMDVTAAVTRCLDDAPMQLASAPTWHELHREHVVFSSDDGGQTSTLIAGPAALATDPVTGATLPLPGAYRGCRILRPSQPDPTAVTWEFDVSEELVLMGGPVVAVPYETTAPDVPLSVRLWDVAADGSAQGLVTRFTYRVADVGAGVARFQLAPQGYRFPAGHRIKVEVVANDSPYYQASNVPAVVTVEGIELTMPLLTEPSSDDRGTAGPGEEPPTTPTTGGGPALPALVLVLLSLATVSVRRSDAGSRRSDEVAAADR